MDILNTINQALRLASNILEIIAQEGDGAGDKRLRDIEGYNELKDEVTNEEEAVRRFREKLAARRAGSGG